MKLYIDPGTGSMLFAILIGIIGAVRYVIKIGILHLKFLLSGGKAIETDSGKIPYAIYVDDKRYWNVFEPICREFDRRGIDITYMTSSPDDPALNCSYEHVKGEFIGEGNKSFAKLNFLDAAILLSTTPGLDVYQWKRSRKVDCYVHIPHAASDITLYRMFGIDYYDAILLSGEFQAEDIRKLEKLRNLPEKELYKVGIPYMDEMAARLKESGPEADHERTILLAPSWGPSAIFAIFGGKIIEKLLASGCHVIVRPHPQSFTSEKDMLDKLMEQFPESDQLEWNRDRDNFEVLKRSDILISDFSGVVFDFTLVYDKPVIYADTKFDCSLYDAWWLDEETWTMKVLPKIGMKLTADDLDRIGEMIDTCLKDPRFAAGRDEARSECWEFFGEGAERTVDWLTDKYARLTKKETK